MRALALWPLIVLVGGCRASYPGDGRLVAVELAPEVARHPVELFTGKHSSQPALLGDLVGQGAHYWDRVGARLRLSSEIGDERPVATLRVEAADALSSAFAGDHSAWYREDTGVIEVRLDQYYDRGFGQTYTSTFAHEFGHAFGLDHEDDGRAVMSPGTSWPRLQPGDVAQFGARVRPQR
jgi:hypothetical protein